MNIPVFDGNLQEWQSFFDLFNSAVHEKVSLTAAQKLQYLKSLLKGEPLRLIKHLNVTDANYVEAYQILNKRYDKKKLTINRYIETFFKQPSITRASASTIRHLADTAEEVIRGLKAIGPLGDDRDPWLVYIIVSKLDDDSRQFWQHESARIEYPTFQNLMDCLQIRADTLEGIREPVNKPIVRMPILRNTHTTFTTNLNCPLCDVEHLLYQCSKFRDMNELERRKFINQSMRCYNCLSDSHTVRTCKSKRSCQICRKRHNSLLHVSNPVNPQSVPRPSTASVVNTVQISPNLSKPESTSTHAAINITPTTHLKSVNTNTSPINIIPASNRSSTTTQAPSLNTHHTIPVNQNSSSSQPTFHSLLPTAMVHVTDARGLMQPCRILLDSGSQASFVTEACINIKSATMLEISPRFDIGPKLKVNALILPTISATLPTTKVNPESWDRLKNLQLADPQFHESGVIDILIGAEHFFEVLTEDKIPGEQGQPVAQNTIFGWIVAGTTSTKPTNCLAHLTVCAEPELDQLLQNFREIEEVPVTKHQTTEEALSETHFAETYQRIVWRESPDAPIADYRLLTVTYGTASAPYLATKTLTTIADIKSTTLPSTTIATKWHELREELNQIDKLSVPRWLFTRDKKVQLHGFSDASELAYAAVIYTRTETEDGTIQTNIVCAKTRVAPIKHLSIPRLELCGALLLTRLMKIVIESLQAESIEIFYWTDSTNVLWWLSSLPRCWKSYVANRTAEILESTSRVNWRYVPTTENPADCASRGIIPSKLHNVVLRWKGPDWLQRDQEFWPTQEKLCQPTHRTNEERPITTQGLSAITTNNLLEDLAPRYSTVTKLIRIIARLCQFLNNIRKSREKEHKSTILSANEYEQSTNIILKWVQQNSFATELACIKNQKLLPKESKLRALNPFIDEHGILRVGSRIKHANIEYSAKFPTILPANHIITDLIIRETHIKYMHAAQSLMVVTLRQRYWIINCKNLVRQHIHRCVQCTRYKPQRQNQLMGDLPPARVNLKYAFNQTGVDYAGPITLRSMVGRRSKSHKGYVAIFVCMSSKAVHIELVSDVSTSAFLAALKRFMARRGLCADMYSDNGTNFVGSRNQLHQIYNLNQSKHHNNTIPNFLLEHQTRWHFSPPSGPNYGGLYESAVKSMKYHLRRVVGNTILNFEEMTTLLTQIEAIMNSRPLCSLPASPDDFEVLTPAHFIIGHSLAMTPDHDHTTTKENLLTRWQHIQYMMQHLWRRFKQEYLTTLHNRSKWQHKQANLRPGDIVLLRDDNTPPAQWPLGRIKQVHPGQDGLVRVASIQAKAGIFKRPISKLVLLPVS